MANTGAFPYTFPFLFYLPDGRTFDTSTIQHRKFITKAVLHMTFITSPITHRKFRTETGQY